MLDTLHLLLIDDDAAHRQAVMLAIGDDPDTVQLAQAAGADEGLALARQQHFDAILVECDLPGQDNLEFLRTLRSDQVHGAPIIMLSRQEDDRLAQQCIEAGAQDFLLKNEFTGPRLMRTVRLAQQRYAMEQLQRRSQVRLQNLAELDVLTGLANRSTFESALQRAVLQAQRQHGRIAVVLLDLDGFKNINDTLGHNLGDQLLKIVADRLAGLVRGSDLLARMGGDEFVVLARNMERDDQSKQLAARLLESLQTPLMVVDGGADVALSITPSIGVAVYGQCADNAADLVKCADIAMYRAKNGGRNQIHFYSEALHHAVLERTTLEQELRLALPRQQFKLYYQAQVGAVDGVLAGVETLLRWQHPTRGLLMPADFLSLAEELGLMGELSNWVMHTACRQLAQWRRTVTLDSIRISVAVNLSALQLQNENLLDMVGNALEESGLDARFLELEITENVFIDQPERAAVILQQLVARGITLSLDDFGTGYSSLQHLQLFPIKMLKIDRSFVACIGHSAQHDKLMAAIIQFGKTLQLTVVAEGVETAEQVQFCRSHGCDLLQGFYISRPLPAQDFENRFLQPSTTLPA